MATPTTRVPRVPPCPPPSSEAASARMRRQRTRDTACETALRREVHRLGLRYRVDRRPLPGVRRRADLVFGPAKVAVFVDGCFWHGCPDHGTVPRSNARWWKQKIAANRARDADTDRLLAAAGWEALRVWEHDDPARAARRVAVVVRRRRATGRVAAPSAARRSIPSAPAGQPSAAPPTVHHPAVWPA